MRIKLLGSSLGNSPGEIVKVYKEESEVLNYKDGLGRYCYIEKNKEHIDFEYVKPQKRKLAKETSKVTKQFGAKETINSGALNKDNDSIRQLKFPICWGAWNKVSIESKFTEKLSYSIRSDLLNKVSKEAKNNLPILHIGFVDKNKKITN